MLKPKVGESGISEVAIVEFNWNDETNAYDHVIKEFQKVWSEDLKRNYEFHYCGSWGEPETAEDADFEVIEPKRIEDKK